MHRKKENKGKENKDFELLHQGPERFAVTYSGHVFSFSFLFYK